MSDFWWGFLVGFFWLVVVVSVGVVVGAVWLLYGVAKLKEKYLANKDFRTNKT